jgi:hypothetical protein
LRTPGTSLQSICIYGFIDSGLDTDVLQLFSFRGIHSCSSQDGR